MTNIENTAEAAHEVGFPVAIKAVTTDAIHKTELGALALDLRDAAAVRAAVGVAWSMRACPATEGGPSFFPSSDGRLAVRFTGL